MYNTKSLQKKKNIVKIVGVHCWSRSNSRLVCRAVWFSSRNIPTKCDEAAASQKNSWWKNKLSLIVDGTKKLNGSHERQGKQAVHAELKALHANLMKGRQRDTMYSESVYTIHVCIQDSQIGGTPLIFFGDLYHNGALSSCLFDRMTYMVYMYIHTYVVLLLQPLHMWLGGCPNPSKMEQCWECTFLNLYTHVNTK